MAHRQYAQCGPGKTRTNFVISIDLLDAVTLAARQEGVTVSEWQRRALEYYLPVPIVERLERLRAEAAAQGSD